MIGFAMELAAWMFVGIVALAILGIIMRCVFFFLELFQGVPSYNRLFRSREEYPNAPWIPPDDFLG